MVGCSMNTGSGKNVAPARVFLISQGYSFFFFVKMGKLKMCRLSFLPFTSNFKAKSISEAQTDPSPQEFEEAPFYFHLLKLVSNFPIIYYPENPKQ